MATQEENVIQNSKPSYEQLQAKVMELVQTCRTLEQRLEAASYIISNKQLDYLFKVVENSQKFSPEFLAYCLNEIESIVWQKDNPTEEK